MTTTTAEGNKQIVRRLVDDFNKKNLNVIDDVFAEDVIDHTPFGESHGRDAVRELSEYLHSAFSDYSLTVEELIAEEDTVTLRGTERGTHDGEFLDIEPTGQKVEFEIMEFNRMKDGQITERWIQPDLLGLMQQLGAGESPGE